MVNCTLGTRAPVASWTTPTIVPVATWALSSAPKPMKERSANAAIREDMGSTFLVNCTELPDQARAQLHGARRIDLGADRAERGAGRADVRRAEGHTVGRIERLEAELQIPPLGEHEIFAHRHVE